jgi:hypothetical protein
MPLMKTLLDWLNSESKFSDMPLPKAKGRSKKAINKQVSKNIHELVHHGTKKRSHAQIVAIAERTARGGKGKKKKK